MGEGRIGDRLGPLDRLQLLRRLHRPHLPQQAAQLPVGHQLHAGQLPLEVLVFAEGHVVALHRQPPGPVALQQLPHLVCQPPLQHHLAALGGTAGLFNIAGIDNQIGLPASKDHQRPRRGGHPGQIPAAHPRGDQRRIRPLRQAGRQPFQTLLHCAAPSSAQSATKASSASR